MALVEVSVEAQKALEGLKVLREDLKVKAVQAGLRRPGALLARTMKAMAPIAKGKGAGNLRKSITARALSRSAGDRLDLFPDEKTDPLATAAVLVGPNKKVVRGQSQAYVGLLVEHGTRPHSIRPKQDGGFLRFTTWGVGSRGQIEHPGSRPVPFMANTLDSASASIESLFFQGLQAFLDKQEP